MGYSWRFTEDYKHWPAGKVVDPCVLQTAEFMALVKQNILERADLASPKKSKAKPVETAEAKPAPDTASLTDVPRRSRVRTPQKKTQTLPREDGD